MYIPVAIAVLVLILSVFVKKYSSEKWRFLVFYPKKEKKIVPRSVNYHFTRLCNYSCGFCFHTSKSSNMQDLERAKKALLALKQEGMEKINFAGGEPFLHPKFLGELVKYCCEELKINVSIVSNGSKIKKKWFEKYAKYLSILAVSCDSFDEETNKKIGRGTGKHLTSVQNVSKLCREFNVRFKMNTVVNSYNWNENMTSHIQELNPFRWKVFQVLILEGENSSSETKRDAREFAVSSEEFKYFCDTHSNIKSLVPESNEQMRNSYLILDENLCFLDCSGGGKEPSGCILDIGVQEALKQSGFDENMFHARGGVYDYAPKKPNLIDW